VERKRAKRARSEAQPSEGARPRPPAAVAARTRFQYPSPAMNRQLSVAAALCAPLLACGPKLVREPVFTREGVTVELRRTVDGGEPVPRGYDHPIQIAAVRVAHILATVSHSQGEEAQRPTIRTEHVYDLAEGIAAALAKAGPDDEAMATASSHDRRLGIFSDRKVTAFAAYVKSDQLHLDFYVIEHDYRDDDPRAEGYEPPATLPASKPGFKLHAATAMTVDGPRGVAVDWRSEFYRKPVNLSVRHGQVRRRTVLMDSEEGDPSDLPIPDVPTDAQIRALDQLDAARRSGLVPEPEFQRRRRLILQGKLEEAGYGGAPESPPENE
jgi:hypothetical protein